ncbi:hypothetical protein HK096_010772, partial [Nowakowskiella sp. JEL0078]
DKKKDLSLKQPLSEGIQNFNIYSPPPNPRLPGESPDFSITENIPPLASFETE